MMSDPASECVPPRYETLMSSTPSAVPSAVPVSNVPVASFFQNVSPPPPTFYIPPSTQTWSVPTGAPQWQLSAIIPQNMEPSAPFFQTFLKGKPKALGILVIVAAILEIGLGIALCFTLFTITLPSGISFWGPVFYIIAGSLTLGAQKKPNICLIKGSLGLNIISSIFSMVALILNIVDLGILQCYSYGYYYYNYNYNSNSNYDYYYNEAQKKCQQQLSGGYAVLSLLLLINLLLFCVTISTSVFDCRSLSKVQNVTQVFMLQNDVVLAMNPGAVPVSIPYPVTTTYAHPPPQPPAYTVNVVKALPDH
ncbi:membrane-spanning 4-domains subfamily A member 4A-like [Rana temporaria]|uniref:membrane-spanning 4-domains subfamily A member 4A-like n=1 Tax=Rana temporaria TaxID=8407 RepID=UPI001AACFE77|nr:membrane-spanning 4-domains subfamily A member 4A-like [Rana temporaria]XP_040177018.1 membrane-spanning 4-domains subfamily A member 4A-like [Rana temporaria]XP_040177019.1 membrane-spanning 4-domains subfamily A member 4A-like [Rana temporaria]